MAEQKQRAPLIGSPAELQARYQVDANAILPLEYEGLMPGVSIHVWTEAHKKMRGFWCHVEFLENPPEEGAAVDFTQTYQFEDGEWVFDGKYVVPQAHWLSKQGEKVVGVGAVLAVFTHATKNVSLGFLTQK